MTDQEINETIAKLFGWTDLIQKLFPDCWLYGTAPYDPELDDRQIMMPIPDYANDLNAMHEAEKSLQGEHDLTWYLQKLSQVRFRQGESGTIACNLDRLAFATARQRAEAFLRVKGLWREEK